MKPEYAVDRKKVAARRPIHPGIIFAEEVMPELRRHRTIGEIATLLGVSRQTLHRVMAGDISISSEMAVRLGELCGNGPGIWIRLQGRYDTWEAARRLGRRLGKDPYPRSSVQTRGWEPRGLRRRSLLCDDQTRGSEIG